MTGNMTEKIMFAACLAIFFIIGPGAWGGEVTRLTIPYLAEAPEIDGKIDPQQWSGAAAVTGAVPWGHDMLSWRQVTFLLGWDEHNLYLAARSYFPPGIRPRFASEFRSDNFELGFFPEGEDIDEPHRLFLNQHDHWLCTASGPWEVEIEMAGSVEPDPDETYGPGTHRWDMEMRLPVKYFSPGMTNRAGRVWRLLLVRNYARPWAQVHIPITAGFFRPEGYVHATLTKGEPAVRMLDVLPLLTGTDAFRLDVAPPHTPRAGVHAKVTVENLTEASVVVEKEQALTMEAGALWRLDMPGEALGLAFGDRGRLTVSVEGPEHTYLSYSEDFQLSQTLVRLREGAAPGLTADIERMVYSTFLSGTYCVEGEGAHVKLTYRSGFHALPRIAPCAERVLLTSYDHEGKRGVWIVDIRERSPRRVTEGEQPSWLPDGQRFVFVRDGAVYITDTYSSFEERLSPQVYENCRFPAVSSDGRLLLFVAGGRGDREDVLYVMNINEKAPKAAAKGEISSPPAWNPDSTKIAFQNGRSIYSTDIDGEDVRALVGEAGIQAYPVWSRCGRGIAYCHSERPGGKWQVRAAPLEGGGGSVLIESDVAPGADVVFNCEVREAEAAPAGLSYEYDREAETGFLTADDMRIASLAGGAVREANVRSVQQGVVFESVCGEKHLKFDLEASSVIIPDRLGDDIRIELGDSAVDLSHASLILLQPSGMEAKLVVAVPHAGRRISASAGRLEVDGGGGAVGVGAVLQGWPSPFSARWRIVDHASGRAAMVSGTAEDVEKFFEEENSFNRDKTLLYLFGRTDQTPRGVWTVSDVVYELFGLNAGKRLLMEDEVLQVQVSEEPVVYPSTSLSLESIDAYLRRVGGSDHARTDAEGFAEDVLRILTAKEKRIGEYRDAWADIKNLAEGNETLLEIIGDMAVEMDETLEDVKSFVDIAELEEAAGRFWETQQEFREIAAVAGCQRTSALRMLRQKLRDIRNGAGSALINADKDERPGLLRTYELSGETLARRHYAEGDWRGEAVQRPYARPWWKDIGA